jgi:TolB protein
MLLDVQATLGLHLPGQYLPNWRTGWVNPSPDGEQVALVLSTMVDQPDISRPPPEYFIYLFHRHTGELRLLVEDGTVPVWSPDGTQLAYRHALTGSLWVVEAGSGQVRELYAVSQEGRGMYYVTPISWSPNGQQIVFGAELSFNSTNIVIVDVNQSQPPHIILSLENYFVGFPQWSPDGDQILFTSPMDQLTGFSIASNLWLMSPDGTEQNQLTQHISAGIGGAPYWSPDGKWIAFSGVHHFVEEFELWADLWLIAADGSNLKRLTSNLAPRLSDHSPIWSPDGTQLVFYRGMNRGMNELWVISLLDGSQTRLPVAVLNASEFIVLP